MTAAANPCPVCRSADTAILDARVEVPVLMNRLYATPQAARAAARGPLELVRCRACGFVWNSAFRAELIEYDGDYENDQTHSEVFARHFRERAEAVVAAAPGDGSSSRLRLWPAIDWAPPRDSIPPGVARRATGPAARASTNAISTPQPPG